MEKNVVDNEKIWSDIIKYLDINDFFNIELTNKSLRSRVTKYYKDITDQFNEKNLKAIKRQFFLMYYNSFVVFQVREEYCKEEEKKATTISNKTFMDNSVSSKNLNENSLFGHNKLIKDTIIKEDRIFVLYHNSEIKTFSLNLYGLFTYEMRLHFPNVDIKKLILINEYDTFIILSNIGKLFSFYYPKIDEIVNSNLSLTLSEIVDLGIVVKNVISIKGYLFLLDEKDNFYFINTLYFNTKKEGEGEEIRDKILKVNTIERNYFNIVRISNSETCIMFMDDSFKVIIIHLDLLY
jgi:hypothetical protein